jgi:phage host-nuclease inhibitor protein Gam
MSKKQKNPRLFAVITTEEELASAVNRHVELSLKLQSMKATHEAAVAALNTEFDRQTADLVAQIGGLEASAQLFAETHRELFPEEPNDGPRSRTYRNATVGFRWNPVKVEKRVNKDTFEAIAERLGELKWGAKYLREFDPEVNKDALIQDQATLTEAQLAQAGIRFSRGETFFIKPVFDSVEAVRKEAA